MPAGEANRGTDRADSGTDRLAIARALREIGQRLKLAGAGAFRARAFLRGASALETQAHDIDALVRDSRLIEIEGIGSGLARVIEEIHRSGRSKLLEGLRAEMPAGILELSHIPSLRVGRIRALGEALGIDSIRALEKACREGLVRTVRGFGPKTESRLLDEIARLREGGDRVHLHRASEAAEALVAHMLASPVVERAEAAGEVRRRCETVSSLPLVATGPRPEAVVERLLAFPSAEGVVSQAARSATVILANGLPVALEWTPEDGYAAALLRRTGSEPHWLRLEGLARARDLGALGELEAADEAALYARLGLPFIPPELREDAGEVEAAAGGSLPQDLLAAADIKGMVHCHTHYSDGRDSVLEMARATRALGFSYLTITDHSPTASYAGGVTLDRLEKQWDDIQRAQDQIGIRILRGTESDILADGALDYPDAVLRQLDVIVASIHNRHRMDKEAMTRRVTRALALPVFKIWGHARGRLINRRPPFECHMDEILDVAAASRVAIEVNGDPYRLDMDPAWIRVARARGLPFVVSVDAHSVKDLRNLRYGVDMARRGWLTPGEVLNTLPATAFAERVRPV